MRKIWEKNSKLILIVTIAIVLASGVTYAATTMYDSNIVGYDNTTSGLRSTNVQSALDELYGNIAEVILNIKNIIGNSTLNTTDQTLSGAINELDDQIARGYDYSSKVEVTTTAKTATADGVIIVVYGYMDTGYLYLNIAGIDFFTSKSATYGQTYCYPIFAGDSYKIGDSSTTVKAYYVPFRH